MNMLVCYSKHSLCVILVMCKKVITELNMCILNMDSRNPIHAVYFRTNPSEDFDCGCHVLSSILQYFLLNVNCSCNPCKGQ